MGRIRTQFIKRKTKELIENNPETFGEDFNQNKKLLEEVAEIPSKKLRNVIAGYITKRMKNKDELDSFTMNE